jgi:phosphatidylserine/phosphatidylglycerophosphate/cardiolipin synthase-like enzyme
VHVKVTMTEDSSWEGAFSQLVAAGAHVRTYAADAPLYIHAKMILTPTRGFLGSENFSDESLFENRELGIVLSAPSIITSLHHTFDTDYAGAQPFRAAAPPAGSSSTPECSASASYSTHYHDYDVYVHSKPAPGDRDRDRHGRTLGQLAHRLRRLRGRVLRCAG